MFIGQQHIKDQVEPHIGAERFPHVLLTGDPGLGKTQFARWLAWRVKTPFYERLAPVRVDRLPVYGMILLDEVHRQSDVEGLFTAMDSGLLTIVGTTTRPGKLDAAFKSRFLITVRLRPYSQEEMEAIVAHMAGRLSDTEREGIPVLARAANGHPRTAERIVRTAKNMGTWYPRSVLKACRITADGLTGDHLDVLEALDRIRRPLGRGQLAETAGLPEDALGRVEKDLVQSDLVELSPQGRRLTVRGEQYVRLLRDKGAI